MHSAAYSKRGMDIPIYYDPMIAKLVTFGKDRREAIERMLRAIEEYQITGIETTLPFGRYVLTHPAFVSGDFDTNFIKDHFQPSDLAPQPSPKLAQLAAVLAAKLLTQQKGTGAAAGVAAASGAAVPSSNWKKNRLAGR